jgi:hypothetical protein
MKGPNVMHPRHALSLAALAAVSVLAAGCGGGGSSGVANVGTSATTTAQNRPVAFPRCMRAHGIPNYPDTGKPTAQQLGMSQSQFDRRASACTYLLPHGGVAQETARQKRIQLADELSFATCMRSHGVARFPDPTAQAQLTIEMVRSQGIDVHAPVVLRVLQRCLPASHGWLTLAKVRAAIDRSGN